MGSEELAANLFRITQTESKIKREDVKGANKDELIKALLENDCSDLFPKLNMYVDDEEILNNILDNEIKKLNLNHN